MRRTNGSVTKLEKLIKNYLQITATDHIKDCVPSLKKKNPRLLECLYIALRAERLELVMVGFG